MKNNAFLIICLSMFVFWKQGFAQTVNGWTIMYYAVGSNSSEQDLLSDVSEMIQGKTAAGYEVIMLIDRIEGFSDDLNTLGENFTDTRLYRFHSNTYEEINGQSTLPEIKTSETFEANMGDADLLKRFIRYCKIAYPANNYMLILRSHGNGVGMCPDAESGTLDKLYPGELRDVLTAEESVNILGLDVCSMAGLENLYEWRPSSNSFSADFIIASAPLSGAWAYDHIFNRLQTSDEKNTSQESNHFSQGIEQNLNPYKMTPLEFAELIIEEIYDSQRWASWGLFDNSIVVDVKQEIDALAKFLVLEEKEIVIEIIQNSLGYHHNTSNNIEMAQLAFPYIDAYDFFKKIAENNLFQSATRSKAEEICVLIDKLVVQSYYGSGFLPPADDFTEGKNGIYIILPIGNKVYSQTGRTFWAHTTWYHPEDKTQDENSYGLYDWCSDGAIKNNNRVDNFFEYLDSLFDDSNTTTGGVNNYQW